MNMVTQTHRVDIMTAVMGIFEPLYIRGAHRYIVGEYSGDIHGTRLSRLGWLLL